MTAPYPVGTPGRPWTDDDKAAWRARQRRQRSYADDVVRAIGRLRSGLDVEPYGRLDYAPDAYEVFALKTRGWRDNLPIMLVTGGVHGYETSGIRGALLFAREHSARYAARANVVVVPCISPWGYERIQRWNPFALDPNRNFRAASPAPECAALMRFVAPFAGRVCMHIDLHETTGTDESEFRPALAARDGQPFIPGTIPDGFYLCGDTARPEPDFQQAVVRAVARVTHIAPADDKGEIIGSPVVAPGVINYPLVEWGLCAGITDARYRTTTEVYPDSAGSTPDECTLAQSMAACAAIDFALERA